MKSAAIAAGIVLLAVRCAMLETPREPVRLVVRAPDLTHPLSDSFPARSEPEDPVKKGVFARVNADRAAHGLPPVAWDEGASRVADAFTAEQVREDTRGHFLLDGLPPYARTGLAGVFGTGAENVVAWTTTGQTFHEPSLGLAVDGEAAMMAEKPPDDGHRRTILDPDVTHVGVGWAQGGGQFRMAEEFQTRRLAMLSLERVAQDPSTVLIQGRTVAGQRLRFVTLGHEPTPRRLTRAQANGRTRYAYPEPRLAYVPEGVKSLQIVGTTTEDRLRVSQSGDFSFRFTPGQPGLWTILFHTSDGRERAKPGGLAVLWVEKAKAP
ncbi:MAG TPA: CAP domain-containing protein [Thermoanaerobaculia bacterium]|nr:CAP domain-containing protein [Thermoanaerobaculia bacterium]